LPFPYKYNKGNTLRKTKNRFDKRYLSFEVIEDAPLPFGRWRSSVDYLFIMRWGPKNPWGYESSNPKSWIGFIGIDLVGPNRVPTVSYTYMKQDYRGRGIGLYMYEKCIEKFGKLSTEYDGVNCNVSPDAIKVWEKLISRHYTRKPTRKYGYIVYPRKKKYSFK
jgi:GNAT superfamily N-acetyltransferase